MNILTPELHIQVRKIVCNMIYNEQPLQPYSDRTMAEAMELIHNIPDISEYRILKLREELGYPTSSQRKAKAVDKIKSKK